MIPMLYLILKSKTTAKSPMTFFSNNEELLAKMQAGGAQFDIIMPSDYMVTTMRKLDMLEKLDLAKIPNAKYISADLRKLPFDPTGEYTPALYHRHHRYHL